MQKLSKFLSSSDIASNDIYILYEFKSHVSEKQKK